MLQKTLIMLQMSVICFLVKSKLNINSSKLEVKNITCSSGFELGESSFSVPHRFNALSTMEGVEAGLRLLPQLRSGGVL